MQHHGLLQSNCTTIQSLAATIIGPPCSSCHSFSFLFHTAQDRSNKKQYGRSFPTSLHLPQINNNISSSITSAPHPVASNKLAFDTYMDDARNVFSEMGTRSNTMDHQH